MTREEINGMIKMLQEELKKMDAVGFETDDIFLLSVEEYEKYKDRIPMYEHWWWLRSPSCIQNYVAYVDYSGFFDYSGGYICNDNICVRPAIVIESDVNVSIGDRLIKHDFPWIKIDENLAIAEVPIATRRFDAESNKYETSEIRKFIKEWKESRK